MRGCGNCAHRILWRTARHVFRNIEHLLNVLASGDAVTGLAVGGALTAAAQGYMLAQLADKVLQMLQPRPEAVPSTLGLFCMDCQLTKLSYVIYCTCAAGLAACE